jgi:hypothetical protein
VKKRKSEKVKKLAEFFQSPFSPFHFFAFSLYYSGTEPEIFLRVVSPVSITGMPSATSECGRGMT